MRFVILCFSRKFYRESWLCVKSISWKELREKVRLHIVFITVCSIDEGLDRRCTIDKSIEILSESP